MSRLATLDFERKLVFFFLLIPIIPNLCIIETPFNAFANRADPNQAALARAA